MRRLRSALFRRGIAKYCPSRWRSRLSRLQSIVGENAFNRASIFEARVLLKAEVGDRSGTARNGFVGTTRMSEVESAEVGSVGVEAGAGLTIPVGTGGSLFMDAALEYRRGWMSADASVGYRIHF